eukprot:9466583-Pyramimonas_sp.AAC.1
MGAHLRLQVRHSHASAPPSTALRGPIGSPQRTCARSNVNLEPRSVTAKGSLYFTGNKHGNFSIVDTTELLAWARARAESV